LQLRINGLEVEALIQVLRGLVNLLADDALPFQYVRWNHRVVGRETGRVEYCVTLGTGRPSIMYRCRSGSKVKSMPTVLSLHETAEHVILAAVLSQYCDAASASWPWRRVISGTIPGWLE
jgi:hypothetical protein